MTFLVTGGCGFLGSNIAAQLLQQNEEVLIVDNMSRYGAYDNLAWLHSIGRFSFMKVDIRNGDEVEDLFKRHKISCVFHLAGQVAMTSSIEQPRIDFDTNVVGSINILESIRLYAPHSAIIYSSSNKVYGDLEWLCLREEELRYVPVDGRRGIDETAPLKFCTPYGCSKGSADQYMLDYAASYGLRTVVFRHSTIYGGRQHSTFDQGWVGWFCRQALIAKRDPNAPAFTISGNGKQVRDLLHIGDAVQCYLNASRSIERAAGTAFNIGGGIANSMSLLELFADLEQRLHINLHYRELPWRQSDQRFFVSDNRKAEQLLHWKPETSKAAGIDEVLEMQASRSRL